MTSGLLSEIGKGIYETLYMTLISTGVAYMIGLPLGVLLLITRKGNIKPIPLLNAAMGALVNVLRSVPFLILMIFVIPVTRAVMGRAIGTQSIIFPLVISAFPYVARMVEGAIREVDHGVIEAAQSMGSTDWQVIRKVMIPEALPSLLNGAAICMVTILGYTAMASAAGGGGLGALAITKGLNMRKHEIMYSASLTLVAMVQIMTLFGNQISTKLDHRIK